MEEMNGQKPSKDLSTDRDCLVRRKEDEEQDGNVSMTSHEQECKQEAAINKTKKSCSLLSITQ
jgi:hypothetical protein